MVEAEAEVKEGEQQQTQPEEEAASPSTQEAERREEAPKEFVCGVCGKAFEKVESLKSHRLRSHRVSPRVELGQEGASEHAPASTLQEAPPLTTYPTDRDHLHNLLTKLKFTRVDAAVEACDVRGFTVVAVYDVLREMNASEAITRSAVSYWSRVKGEPIPYYIKTRLGIRDVMDDYQSRAGYGGYDSGYGYGGYGYPARQHEGDILTGVGNLIRAMKEDGGLSQQGGGDNELITQLQGQVSNLQKELHELREDQTRKEVQGLKEEITELKKLLEKNSGDAQLNFLDKRFRQVGEKTDRLINVLDPISKAYGRRVYESYTGEPLPAPEREAQEKGRKGVMDLLPNELIEEEAQREVQGGQQT